MAAAGGDRAAAHAEITRFPSRVCHPAQARILQNVPIKMLEDRAEFFAAILCIHPCCHTAHQVSQPAPCSSSSSPPAHSIFLRGFLVPCVLSQTFSPVPAPSVGAQVSRAPVARGTEALLTWGTLSKAQVCAVGHEMHPRASPSLRVGLLGLLELFVPLRDTLTCREPSLHLCALGRII